MTLPQSTSDELVLRARSDREAFGELYDRHYAGVLRYCIHRLFDRDMAEDMTSALFLEVAGRIATFTGRTEEDFANWLYCIATRQINAHLSRSARRRELLANAVADRRLRICPGEEKPAEKSLDWPGLYRALAELSPLEQAVVTLRSFEDLPYERIAVVVGKRTGTVRVIHHRALAQLRTLLERSPGGPEEI